MALRVVFMGGGAGFAEMVRASVGLRWPEVTVLVAETAREGLELVRQVLPDLIVIYPEFSDMSLREVLQELRQVSNAPLLVLGREGYEEEEAMAALSMDADFIWPPPDATVVMVRVWSLLRSLGLEPPGLAPPDLGELLQVVQALDQAIRLNPYDRLAYASRALAYTLMGNDTAAQQDVERAVELGVDRELLERSIEELKRQR